MSQANRLPTEELREATEFCSQEWGWESPPQTVIDRAILTLRFRKKKSRVGEIIADLGILTADKVNRLAEDKESQKSATPLIDFIIQNDTDSSNFPDMKSTILAYKNAMQHFDDLSLQGLTIHPEMHDSNVRTCAIRFDAILMLIESRVPVLVFSGFNDGYQKYVSEGRLDQLGNALKKKFPHLQLATGNPDQIATELAADRASVEVENRGRNIIHSELIGSDDEGKKKLAQIHDYVIRNKGTDIHIDPSPFDNTVIVKGRFDTNLMVLPSEYQIGKSIYQQIKQYLTAQSGAVENNAVLQKPADGRYTYCHGDKRIDVRCAFAPTGQEIVFTENMLHIRLRLLVQSHGAIELEKYGIAKEALVHMIRAVRAESGMSIIVGPTGAGKSTTLLGLVNEHYKLVGNSKSRLSIEDPVERKAPNIQQLQITDEIKRTSTNPFLTYLKYLLRFDPDFLMLGEMRDKESIEAAGNYANTGHVVISTLHANDTITAIERIMNMLKDDDLRRMIIESLHYIFSQRLIPILCNSCKIKRDVDESLRSDLSAHVMRYGNDPEKIPTTAHFKSDKGCEKCNQTGISGRVPVSEVLEISDKAKEVIFSGRPDRFVEMRSLRALTLFEETLKLVNAGKASVKELFK